MALTDWLNHFNDGESTDVTTAGLSGAHTAETTTLFLSSFELTDSDGGTNWKVGDSLFVSGSAATKYKIESISTNTGSSEESILTIDTGLVQTLVTGTTINKWGGGGSNVYKGSHGSFSNHLRLRNRGQI